MDNNYLVRLREELPSAQTSLLTILIFSIHI